jgi:hypothetical protein
MSRAVSSATLTFPNSRRAAAKASFCVSPGLYFLPLCQRQVRLDFFLQLLIALPSSPESESHVSLSFFGGFKTPEIA